MFFELPKPLLRTLSIMFYCISMRFASGILGEAEEPYSRAERARIAALSLHAIDGDSRRVPMGSRREHRAARRESADHARCQGPHAQLSHQQRVRRLELAGRRVENSCVRPAYF